MLDGFVGGIILNGLFVGFILDVSDGGCLLGG